MVRLLERGAESRRVVIAALQETPSQTEDELMESTGLSRSTVRNVVQLLLQAEMASSKRRKRDDGRRGPGPIEYWLAADTSLDAGALEAQLKAKVEGQDEGLEAEVHHVGEKTVTVRAQKRSLFVLVKAGTNDAVLTKQGTMLRVEEHAIERVRKEYERVLRGTELEPMGLDDYYRRFYPEFKGRGEPPVT